MKKLQKKDLIRIKQLHDIYSTDTPQFIEELEKCPELQRLKEVGQNCGNDYLNKKIQAFSFNYSRYDHSVGVALIIWKFTQNVKMSLAGLFHDIATPTFAHVIDFLNNDAEKQTSTENGTEAIIKNSKEIQALLEKYNLNTDDVSNYALYPIADNKLPKLSADRLEYSMYMGVSRGIITMQEASQIFNDIIIKKNEFGEDEMCFKTVDLAKKFTKLALDNGMFMSSGISNMSNQLLADILKIALDRCIITTEDFSNSSEEEIVKKLNTSTDEKMKKLWVIYQDFDKVYEEQNFQQVSNKYEINVKVKHRYINPLCMQNDEPTRITSIDGEIAKAIEDFAQKNSNKYYSISFNDD